MKNLENLHIHFVGIGGISMSALAHFALSQKAVVTGTEKTPSSLTKELEKLGVKITKHQNKIAIKKCDLVVFSGAIKSTHPDLVFAKKLKKEIWERPKFLNFLSKNFNTTIAVSGTHGKTTTTAMLAKVLSPLFPTVHVGGLTQDFGNFKLGKQDVFLSEACEFKQSFLLLKPNISVILNLEQDHMEFYKTKSALIKSFNKFLQKTQDFAVINHDFLSFFDQNFAKAKIVTFGFSENSTIFAKNLSQKNGKFCFDVWCKKKFLGNVKLNIFGKHNVQNALATICVGILCKQSFENIKKALENFCLPKRRFEILSRKKFWIIRDYAHHPTEIKCTLKTAKEICHKKVFCVFEPHTFSRTIFLFQEFLKCFCDADVVIFLPTFSAREKPQKGGTSFDLFSRLKHPQKHYFKNKNDCFDFLSASAKSGDIILFVGAGSVGDFALEFSKKAKN